jgi:hypothetical protein
MRFVGRPACCYYSALMQRDCVAIVMHRSMPLMQAKRRLRSALDDASIRHAL